MPKKESNKIENEPIVIHTDIQVNENPHNIPVGTMINIRITIMDEYEIIKTSNNKFTEDLAKVPHEGTVAKYSKKHEKTILKFPGMTKEQIEKIVRKDLKKLPTN